jgi:hypothetical protein
MVTPLRKPAVERARALGVDRVVDGFDERMVVVAPFGCGRLTSGFASLDPSGLGVCDPHGRFFCGSTPSPVAGSVRDRGHEAFVLATPVISSRL